MRLRSRLLLAVFLLGSVPWRETAGQSAGAPAGYGERLHGSWFDGAEEKRFAASGRGTYLRGGAPCFMFSYTLDGRTLAETPDGPNACGGTQAVSQIDYVDGNLVQTYGDAARIWKRVVEQRPPLSADARHGIEKIVFEDGGYFIRFRKDAEKMVEVVRDGNVAASYSVSEGVVRLVTEGGDNGEESDGIFVGADHLTFSDSAGGRKLLVYARKVERKNKGHICWIDRLRRTADGLALSFRASASLRVMAGGNPPAKYYVEGGIVRAADGVVSTALAVQEGQRLLVMQLIEDSCTIDVVSEGVRATAVMHMPGLPGQTAEEFVAVEGD